jgi:hypothetical protein
VVAVRASGAAGTIPAGARSARRFRRTAAQGLDEATGGPIADETLGAFLGTVGEAITTGTGAARQEKQP